MNREDQGVSQPGGSSVLSSVRLSLTLVGLLLVIVVGLTTLIIFLVGNIFQELTPAIESDLRWKALRGANELSRTADIGIVLDDEKLVLESFSELAGSTDVVNIIARDANGRIVAQVGSPVPDLDPFGGRADTVRAIRGVLCAWSSVEIEGVTVGKVAIVISLARLETGRALRQNIVIAAVVGGGVAFLLGLLYILLYLVPLVRLTTRAFADLEEKRREAMESARLKGEFLANMSHEIRTPMNGVLGTLQLVMQALPEGKQRDYIELAQKAGNDLLILLNDILDFSKIDAGRLDLEMTDFNLRESIQRVAKLTAVRGHAKGLEVACLVHSDVPTWVHGDPGRVRQVLTNLAANAVKFTHEGEVILRARTQESQGERVRVELEVSDTGPGIPPEAQELIFESFRQVDGSHSRTFGGTGLGLAISQELATLMGGELTVQSEIGKGSTFCFSVWFELRERREALELPSAAAGLKVLAVDDNETNRLILGEQLQQWGFAFSLARDGAQALELLREAADSDAPFSMAIVDAQMPIMDGFELVERIRAESRLQGLKVVMLTSMGQRGDAKEAADVGADAYLTKPVDPIELHRCLLHIGAVEPSDEKRAMVTRYTIAEAMAAQRPRILIAEDNEVNQIVTTEMVRELGCEAEVAIDGERALEALAANEYDLVLMDCHMPGVDGYEATRRLRERERAGKHVPVFALTADAMSGTRERVLDAGMDDYLTKPVELERLRAAIARWVPAADLASGRHLRAEARDSSSKEEHEILQNGFLRPPEVIEIFLTTARRDVGLLRDLLGQRAAKEAGELAHKLKGGCRVIGAQRMAERCLDIERTAKAGAVDPAALAALESAYQELTEALRQELARGAE